MKHFMQPRNAILRDTHAVDPPSSSPSPSGGIKGRPPRKPKSSKENAPPSDPNSMVLDPKPSPAKLKSPLPPRPPSSNPLKRKLSMETVPENSIPGLSDSGVKVVVRMRPPCKDRDEGDNVVQKASEDSLSINGQTFTFDAVADTEATQLDIFQLVGEPLVENCMAGFNSSVFAYGQTGSGKTYTMWGPANVSDDNLLTEQKGLTPRVFERLFARINEEQVKHADKLLKYQCYCSFLEIYNEQITDLLDPNQRNLQIREDVKSGVYVENLTEECVSTMADVIRILMKGLSNRRTGATSVNSESSRSHTVFTCVVESRSKRMADGLSSFKTSRINLVDLAGSERQKLTGAAGERLKEAGNINRSLSQLGNLINILAEISQTGKQRHIPYRDSRLTFLLQESLGGNAKLAMVCAISPSQSCKSESLSTLRFAQRAKAIKNKAIVNEVMQDDVNHLREVIRQLRDELHRLKSNGSSSTDTNGGHSAAWIRRSLNLLKSSINHPISLPHVDDDGDEDMEIDEEAVEKLCDQLDKQNAASQVSEGKEAETVKSVSSIALKGNELTKFEPCASGSECQKEISDEIDVNMEEETSAQDEVMIVGSIEEPVYDTPVCSAADLLNHHSLAAQSQMATDSPDQILIGEPSDNSVMSSSMERVKSELKTSEDVPLLTSSEPLSGFQATECKLDTLNNSSNGILSCVSPPGLSIVPCDVSPILKSPTPSVSPRISESRKSLRTSMMLSASQKDLQVETKLGLDHLQKSFEKSLKRSSANALSLLSTQSKNTAVTTEQLAASIRNGLEIIDSCRQSSALRRSSFRFSYKPAEKVNVPINKIDVGMQTSRDDEATGESLVMCTSCKIRKQLEEDREENGSSELQLVPVDGTDSAEKSRIRVPKAVEKVLAGAIRREMALEEYCIKQAFDISQLNRLLQQYKHERECNAVLGQAREDKILRLESLMDGVLPTEEFMEEELLSLTHEHKVLKDKYENHPEVLQTRMELKKVQDELQSYRNFYDLGEREVLMEEIQDLRIQLQYYIDSPSASSRKQNSLLQLTYSEPSSAPLLGAIPESTEESAEEKLEQERARWTEAESRWISLSEELRSELEASRLLAEKRKREFEAEKKCAEELEEAMRMAMAGHARLLEQYADLEEKHMQLLLRHRKIQDGIGDVKKAAARAGVKGAESKFINALAAEISALKVEREREKRYLRNENKGLQAQLRDTVEAVQAAGELLVRLKEAEEGVAAAQRRTIEVEQEAEKAYKQIDKLKKKHEKEIATLNALMADSRLPKEAIIGPAYENETSKAKYDMDESHDQRWREEFEPFYNGEDGELLPKLSEPSWFSGYDRCNI
ncbi:kinesin-like protein KIN-12B isoform X1 [Cucurbita maxima]|uniref:Kinesin-like protein KIN-12B isoform X1 n=1 Tax=Cucurbita maxima TaxID=3661 RepID=A0A6J1IWX7_CUCMA|nr:kinesin-like protein KIN-12B isoform X1 [Cucurbita maxima]